MRGFRFLTTTAALLALASAARGGVKSRGVYVDDIDEWQVEVFAGASNTGGLLQGPAREAGLGRVVSMCFLPSGEAYLAVEGALMVLTKDRTIRLACGMPGMPGHADGPVSEALLGRQLSITPDNRGGLYIGDRSNRCVRRLTKKEGAWVVETVAGDPSKPEWGRKPTDGAGAEVVFKYLHANVIADKEGNAYVMDRNFLRRITPDGKVETLNPGGGSGKPGDGALEGARFNLIMGAGMCFGGDGNIYVADRWNFCFRKVDLKAKQVTTVIGPAKGNVDGPEREAGFHGGPTTIVYDPYRKRFHVAGADDVAVRVWEGGFVKTLAGRGRGFEGPARGSKLVYPGTLAFDPRPPHVIYFRSNTGGWRDRIGRLYRKGGAKASAPAENF